MATTYGDFLMHLKDYMFLDSWPWLEGIQGPHLDPLSHPPQLAKWYFYTPACEPCALLPASLLNLNSLGLPASYLQVFPNSCPWWGPQGTSLPCHRVSRPQTVCVEVGFICCFVSLTFYPTLDAQTFCLAHSWLQHQQYHSSEHAFQVPEHTQKLIFHKIRSHCFLTLIFHYKYTCVFAFGFLH